MRSFAGQAESDRRTERPVTVWIDRGRLGMWEVEMPDRRARVPCETLDDAMRVAYLYAARRRACELIVRDAQHRVLDHEHIRGRSDPRSPQSGPSAS